MSKKALAIMIAVSMIGLYGCGDDKKKDDPQGEKCERSYCNGSISVYCVGNATQTQDCGAAGCNEQTGLCNSSQEKCERNYCNGNISVYCVGNATQTQDCGTAGCNEQTGMCNSSSGTKCEKNYCNGDVSIYCLNGTEQLQNCGTAGCNQQTGLCNGSAEPPKCNKNYCNGDMSIFCLNGTEMLQGCGAAGCNEATGLCNSSTHTQEQPEECSKNECAGSIANICSRGVITPFDCGTAGCNEMTGVCNAPNSSGPAQCSGNTCTGSISSMCVNGTILLKDCGADGCNETTGTCNTATQQPACQKSTCLGSVANLCVDGINVPVACPLGCDPDTGSCRTQSTTTAECTADSCSGDFLNLCIEGKIYTRDCGSDGCDATKGRCNSNSSSVQECETSKCEGQIAKMCKNGVLFTMDCQQLGCNPDTAMCNTQVVSGGITHGGNVGDTCDTVNYEQSCINNNTAALYCDNGKVKQMFCSSCKDAGYDQSKPLQVFCENGSGNQSELTEGGNVGDSCSRTNYKSTCINGGKNALVCWNSEVTQWDCASCEAAGYNAEKPLEVKCIKEVPSLAEGGNIGDACSASVYKQTCINGGANALICKNGEVAQWDCASCEDAGYDSERPLYVNCPKPEQNNCVTTGGQPGVDCCDRSNYQVSCKNNGANALICAQGMVKQWDCAGNICSVSENQVYCPKEEPATCATTAGTVGECCDEAMYQNTCINSNANALICRSGKIRQWNCADNHCIINNNEVDCPLESSEPTTCATEGGEPGDCCDENDYFNTCINEGANALVCQNGKIKKWTCAENHCEINYNEVDCPMQSSTCITTGGNPGDCCDKSTYIVSCINENANALICSSGKVKQLTCAGNECTVDTSINYATCPQQSTCPTTGGNVGDCCDKDQYLPSCINENANALICASGRVKQWTCAESHCEVNDNSIDCPEPQNPDCPTTGGNPGDCCQKKYYQVSCSSDNSRALYCNGSIVKEKECVTRSCSIANNYVTCE